MKKPIQILIFLILSINQSLMSKTTDLFISEYGEGSGDNKYIEIYNGTQRCIDLQNYRIWLINNKGKWAEKVIDLNGTLENGKCLLIARDDDNTSIELRSKADILSKDVNWNGNDCIALVNRTKIIDQIGIPDNSKNPPYFDCAGVKEALKDHTLIRKEHIHSPNNSWELSAGSDTENSEWIVLEKDNWDNLGSHNYLGFDNKSYCNRDVDLNDSKVIVNQSYSSDYCRGVDAHLFVDVRSDKYNYIWYRNGNELMGKTSPSLMINDLNKENEGIYTCALYDPNEGDPKFIFSDDIVVKIIDSPQINEQSVDLELIEGDSLNLDFSINLLEDYKVEWYKDNEKIKEINSETKLKLQNIKKEDEGEYFAVVNNQCGYNFTEVILLTVKEKKKIEIETDKQDFKADVIDLNSELLKLMVPNPNPVNSTSIINYYLPQKTHVKLTLNDLSNNIIYLVDREQNKGYHSINFIPKNHYLISGTYYLNLTTPSESKTVKVIVTY